MADLKTDYKDDILDTSQNTRRKYQMVDNGDGTVSFVDVTEYIQQGDSFGADDTNATNTKVNALESDIDEINDNLSGFKYYQIGTELVAFVADDSFYKDVNDKYVLADSTTGQTLLEDTTTYKTLASTEDCRGMVGADTCIPFSKKYYLYFNGTIRTATNRLAYVNLGFRASKIWGTITGVTTPTNIIFWYDKDLGEKMYRLKDANTTVHEFTLPQTDNWYTGINDIDNHGFNFIGDASTTYRNVMIYAEP